MYMNTYIIFEIDFFGKIFHQVDWVNAFQHMYMQQVFIFFNI